ncbi:hypothetical protein SEVCU050_1043 [Staphylococcus epidermidis VCU050]|nr:hypothetical protein SEVCU127_0680 [Staphylococcus epidermidis VCU127]EZI14837.1 hypothetical protein SEVCU050_1043 [Staphylococcus epidermidis VCU050]
MVLRTSFFKFLKFLHFFLIHVIKSIDHFTCTFVYYSTKFYRSSGCISYKVFNIIFISIASIYICFKFKNLLLINPFINVIVRDNLFCFLSGNLFLSCFLFLITIRICYAPISLHIIRFILFFFWIAFCFFTFSCPHAVNIIDESANVPNSFNFILYPSV